MKHDISDEISIVDTWMKAKGIRRGGGYKNIVDKRVDFAIRELNFKIRGTQPLCRLCEKECKVLDAPNSTFICMEFKEKDNA